MTRTLNLTGFTALFFIVLLWAGCAGTMHTDKKKSAPSIAPIEVSPPEIMLSFLEIERSSGWWYFSRKIKPTHGTHGDYGAPLELAFIFDIHNTNALPVRMETLSFTVAFETYDIQIIQLDEIHWIPSGKTNQLRVHAMLDGRQSLLHLLISHKDTLRENVLDAYDLLNRWWTGAPQFAFPIHVKKGAAVFTAEGKEIVSEFSATFPK